MAVVDVLLRGGCRRRRGEGQRRGACDPPACAIFTEQACRTIKAGRETSRAEAAQPNPNKPAGWPRTPSVNAPPPPLPSPVDLLRDVSSRAGAEGSVRGQVSGVAGACGSTGSRLSRPTRPLRAGDIVGLFSGPWASRAMFFCRCATTAVGVMRVDGPAVRVPPACAIFTGQACRTIKAGRERSRGRSRTA